MAGTGDSLMQNRRDFVRTMAGASAGFYAAGGRFDLLAQAPTERRQVSIAGRRIKVVDVHAHGTVPEVAEVVKGTPYERQGGNQALGGRIALLDKQGIDVQALSINVFWWYDVKRLGLRGAPIGGHVNGEDLSLPKYDPFWAKAEELGAFVFMHPGGADNIIKDKALAGRGDLGNIMGNPLETA